MHNIVLKNIFKDFIGRTYVLDESAFANTDGYEQLELFDDVTKELPSGYGERFEEYRNEIEDVIETGKTVDGAMRKYGYLVSYIRQSVLRYGKDSQKRMKDVGIKLTQKQVAAIILKLDTLTVPKNICIKNRYWDPFVLQKIFEDYGENVPVTPYERGARAKLNRMLKSLALLLANIEIMTFDASAAEHYGKIRAALENQGTPIVPLDMMIAGHAMSLGYIVVTNNTKEFHRIKGLKLENWAE